MSLDGKLVTCINCGWVHMGVTADYVRSQVAEFNAWFQLQPADVRDSYGGVGASHKDYLSCDVCSQPYTGMRPYKEGDCPEGVTIGPILLPSENWTETYAQ